jgi:hypothetical protein
MDWDIYRPVEDFEKAIAEYEQEDVVFGLLEKRQRWIEKHGTTDGFWEQFMPKKLMLSAYCVNKYDTEWK